MTLRHLLTHTAGFTYEAWNANTRRYVEATGMPSTRPASSRRCANRSPSTPAKVGIRHQHRLGRPHRRGGIRQADRRVVPRPHLRAARHDAIPGLRRAEQRARQANVHLRGPTAARPAAACPRRSSRNSRPAAAGSTRPRATIYLSRKCCCTAAARRSAHPEAGDRRADEPEPCRRSAGRHADAAWPDRLERSSISFPASRSAGDSATC